jgi:hypothetical protein
VSLGPALIGLVVGLAIVGAVLLRNEEKVREEWRRRRGPAAPAGRGLVMGFGLIAIANIAFAVIDGGVFRIALAAAWVLTFCFHLQKYRRSTPARNRGQGRGVSTS